MIGSSPLSKTIIGIGILLLAIQTFWKPFDVPELKKILPPDITPIGIIYQYFNFNEKNALGDWDEKIFKGRVHYWVDLKNEDGFVHSKSKKTASAIFKRLKYDVLEYPYLSWKWYVNQFPKKKEGKGDGTDAEHDDFAARVYVVFPSRFFTDLRCVEYIWDKTLPEGTVIQSPFSENIKQLVIQSGIPAKDEWASEFRNVAEDYKMLFGETPKRKVAAIAIMTDADGTESVAESFYDEIKIGKGLPT
jgi:hypothetical protein